MMKQKVSTIIEVLEHVLDTNALWYTLCFVLYNSLQNGVKT